MSGELLEKLAQEEQCFISDLKLKGNYWETAYYLRKLDLSQFSLEECSYALSYIFQDTLTFYSYEEIYHYINDLTIAIKEASKRRR